MRAPCAFTGCNVADAGLDDLVDAAPRGRRAREGDMMIDAIRPSTVAQLMRGLGDQQFGAAASKDLAAKVFTSAAREIDEVVAKSSATAGVDALVTTRAEHAVGMRRAALLRPH